MSVGKVSENRGRAVTAAAVQEPIAPVGVCAIEIACPELFGVV